MINQKELAFLVGVTPQHLSAVIAGKYNASKKLAMKLGKRTNSDPGVWIFGKPAERKLVATRMRVGVQR